MHFSLSQSEIIYMENKTKRIEKLTSVLGNTGASTRINVGPRRDIYAELNDSNNKSILVANELFLFL